MRVNWTVAHFEPKSPEQTPPESMVPIEKKSVEKCNQCDWTSKSQLKIKSEKLSGREHSIEGFLSTGAFPKIGAHYAGQCATHEALFIAASFLSLQLVVHHFKKLRICHFFSAIQQIIGIFSCSVSQLVCSISNSCIYYFGNQTRW